MKARKPPKPESKSSSGHVGKAAPRAAKKRKKPSPARAPLERRAARPLAPADLDALRAEIERRARAGGRARFNADPKDVERSVARLVLTLVEFIRRLLERQAVRRMDEKTLSPAQVEAMGLALMRLEKTIDRMARRFGIEREDLNLDLGALGTLM